MHIKIYLKDEKISKKVQTHCYNNKIFWMKSDGKRGTFHFLTWPFMFINDTMSAGNDFQEFKRHKYTELTPEEFLRLDSSNFNRPCYNCGETRRECACTRNKCIKCGNPVGNISFTVCDDCLVEKEKRNYD